MPPLLSRTQTRERDPILEPEAELDDEHDISLDGVPRRELVASMMLTPPAITIAVEDSLAASPDDEEPPPAAEVPEITAAAPVPDFDEPPAHSALARAQAAASARDKPLTVPPTATSPEDAEVDVLFGIMTEPPTHISTNPRDVAERLESAATAALAAEAEQVAAATAAEAARQLDDDPPSTYTENLELEPMVPELETSLVMPPVDPDADFYIPAAQLSAGLADSPALYRLSSSFDEEDSEVGHHAMVSRSHAPAAAVDQAMAEVDDLEPYTDSQRLEHEVIDADFEEELHVAGDEDTTGVVVERGPRASRSGPAAVAAAAANRGSDLDAALDSLDVDLDFDDSTPVHAPGSSADLDRVLDAIDVELDES